ncbi:MAG TPA: response regulator transcription factor [Sediminispirochaeta sp.]|nr:response regulator transcription factor [Sediminispirochaeta sp.]
MERSGEKIRVVLVDDQVLFIESLKTVLDFRAEDIEVVGVAHNGVEAIEVIRREQPDVVLMDVRMPVFDGVEATKRIRQELPDIKVVMLTTFDDDNYVREAMRYNALGYILKNIPPGDLIESIRAVRSGTIQLSPNVMHKILGNGPPAEDGQTPSKLSVAMFSRREREIMYLISLGLDNMAIAERLFIAEQTVKNHISKIYNKIGTHDRVKTAEIARRLDLAAYCTYLD